jgi:hypothetical protein
MAPITLTKSQFQSKRPGGDYSKYLGFINKRRSSMLGAVNADPLAPTPAGRHQRDRQPVRRHVRRPHERRADPDRREGAARPDRRRDHRRHQRPRQDLERPDRRELGRARQGSRLDRLRRPLPDGAGRPGERRRRTPRGARRPRRHRSRRRPLEQALDHRRPRRRVDRIRVGDRGAALGTTELARGSTNIGSLIAQAAAGKEYGLKQPGIARESGLQDIAGVNKTAVSEISDKTAQLLQQLPTIVANLRNSSDSRAQARAAAAAQLYETLTGQNITKATAKAGLANSNFDNGLAYASTFGVDPLTGQPVKGYHVDAHGNVVKDATPAKVAPGGRNGLTADQLAGMQHDAGKAAADLYHGVTKTVNGQQVVVSYTQTYQDAIKTLMQQYPKLGRRRS